jgi:hypothetical protein
MHEMERAEREDSMSDMSSEVSPVTQSQIESAPSLAVASTSHAFEPTTADEDVGEGDTEDFVRDYMASRQIEVLFDGALFLRGRPLQAITVEDIDAVLAVDPPSVLDLLDEIVLFARSSGARFKKVDLTAALRQVLRTERRRRYQIVMRPLLATCSPNELERAMDDWNKMGGLFDIDGDLAIAVLKHFCWSVKQKQLGRPVVHHCMPIIFSSTQGTGKTVFVKRFLAPLRELATDSALFSDLADRRSGDIFRFPVILLDDMERIPPSAVPALKAVLTSDKLRRRRLGTSLSDGIRQACVPIGTSNQVVHELVEDHTGHRRFAMLPFRNGAVVKGGDITVWDTVNAIDYELLWRSVDAFAASPILPHLEDLQRHQGIAGKERGLLGWLLNLDLQSEAIRNLTTRKGLRAQSLHALFMAQTRTEMSAQRFADEMGRHCLRPDTPFGDKVKTEAGALYRLKHRTPDDDLEQQKAGAAFIGNQSSASGSSGPSASSGPSGSSATGDRNGESRP